MIAYLIAYNLLSPLRRLVDDVRAMDGIAGVTIIDNASTYPPLLDWYDRCDCQVIRRRENQGPTRSFEAVDKTDWYVLSDSDLDVSQVPRDAVVRLRAVLESTPEIKKAGLSLETADIPDTPLGEAMRQWETKFWAERFNADYWRADIATTFAVYRPGKGWGGYGPALRADRPYTARHTPWRWDLENLTEEQQYYLSQKFVGTWWSAKLKRSIEQPETPSCPTP